MQAVNRGILLGVCVLGKGRLEGGQLLGRPGPSRGSDEHQGVCECDLKKKPVHSSDFSPLNNAFMPGRLLSSFVVSRTGNTTEAQH